MTADRRGRLPVGLMVVVCLLAADVRGVVDLGAWTRTSVGVTAGVVIGTARGSANVLASAFPGPPLARRRPPRLVHPPAAGAPAARKAVAFALQQRGKPFRWAATGPDAYDCSGLMVASWRAAGVTIPRTAQSQLDGLPRARGGLRPGDLLIYRSDGPTRRHVAMVIGGGRMVEAPRSGVSVRSAALRRGYLGAVRPTAAAAPHGAARSDIPARYSRLYREAGAGSGVAWQVLAAVGKVESDHGRAPLPGVRSGVNAHGCCGGPMQFNLHNGPPSTWDTWGRGGNVYDPADAIPAAARMLRAHGYGRATPATTDRRCPGIKAAPGTINALRRYNNACWYVSEVLTVAAGYRRS